jgi:hypothetical protein
LSKPVDLRTCYRFRWPVVGHVIRIAAADVGRIAWRVDPPRALALRGDDDDDDGDHHL